MNFTRRQAVTKIACAAAASPRVRGVGMPEINLEGPGIPKICLEMGNSGLAAGRLDEIRLQREVVVDSCGDKSPVCRRQPGPACRFKIEEVKGLRCNSDARDRARPSGPGLSGFREQRTRRETSKELPSRV